MPPRPPAAREALPAVGELQTRAGRCSRPDPSHCVPGQDGGKSTHGAGADAAEAATRNAAAVAVAAAAAFAVVAAPAQRGGRPAPALERATAVLPPQLPPLPLPPHLWSRWSPRQIGVAPPAQSPPCRGTRQCPASYNLPKFKYFLLYARSAFFGILWTHYYGE